MTEAPGHPADEDLDVLIEWGRRRRIRRLLDVASGDGNTARAFAHLAERVITAHPTEPMARQALGALRDHGTTNVDALVAEVEALPLREASCDIVTCRLVVHQLVEPARAVRQMARFLAPGGSLLLQDTLGHDDGGASAFMAEVERRGDAAHVRSYRAAEWKAFLRAAGLTVIDERRLSRVIGWAEWIRRLGLARETVDDLQRFIQAAPASCRDGFAFRMTAGAIESFSLSMILVRADRD